ncbi:MAG TPA: TolC family protein [Bacteroidales bacterium]|nr:TolC family protein [Bacteroidales bacterium]
MKLFILSLLMFVSNCINGQAVYDLKYLIEEGLERNFSILIAKNNLEISENNYTRGNAGMLPSVDLSGRHNGSLTNSQNNLTNGSTESNTGIFNTTNNASVSLSLNIFNGFNAVTTYKKLSELTMLGQLNTQLNIENLIADIVTGYYNYILQVQLLKNLRYALSLSHERLRIDQQRYLLGSGSKLEVLQSQVYVNTDSSALSRQAETVKHSMIRLNELIALDDLAADFTSQDTIIIVDPGLLFDNLSIETSEKNTNLLIASANRIISDYDYKITMSRSYPYVNFSGGYNQNFNTFSDSPSRSVYSNGINYGMTLGISLFDGFNQRRNIRNAEISRENSDLRFREIEQGIRADLLNLFSAYSNNLRLISLEEQNLETASENNYIAIERYRLGSLSGIELREVQLSLLNANERLVSAQYQTKLAEVSLNLISGNIMKYYQ